MCMSLRPRMKRPRGDLYSTMVMNVYIRLRHKPENWPGAEALRAYSENGHTYEQQASATRCHSEAIWGHMELIPKPHLHQNGNRKPKLAHSSCGRRISKRTTRRTRRTRRTKRTKRTRRGNRKKKKKHENPTETLFS